MMADPLSWLLIFAFERLALEFNLSPYLGMASCVFIVGSCL